VRKTFMCYST